MQRSVVFLCSPYAKCPVTDLLKRLGAMSEASWYSHNDPFMEKMQLMTVSNRSSLALNETCGRNLKLQATKTMRKQSTSHFFSYGKSQKAMLKQKINSLFFFSLVSYTFGMALSGRLPRWAESLLRGLLSGAGNRIEPKTKVNGNERISNFESYPSSRFSDRRIVSRVACSQR